MTLLGIWLLAVALADLVRARRDRVDTVHVLLTAALGVVVLVGLALAVEVVGTAWWVLAATAVGLVFWVVASAAALNHRGVRGGRTDRTVAMASLVATVVVLLATSGRSDASGGVVQRWYDGLGVPGLAGVPMETFLVAAGLFGLQLSTANLLVRMVLDGVGAPASRGEQTLRGGRMLGPLERVFILGLGMAGHVTAASIVIAAKGLLRYPELRESRENLPEGAVASEVSEYFLVGSFVSWLIAMAGLPLV